MPAPFVAALQEAKEFFVIVAHVATLPIVQRHERQMPVLLQHATESEATFVVKGCGKHCLYRRDRRKQFGGQGLAVLESEVNDGREVQNLSKNLGFPQGRRAKKASIAENA